MKFFGNLAIILFLLHGVLSYGQTRRQNFVTSDRQIDLVKLANDDLLFLFDDFYDAVVYYPGGQNLNLRVNYSILQDAIYGINHQNSTSILSTTLRFDSIHIPAKRMVLVWNRESGYMEKVGSGNTFQIRHRTTHTFKEVKAQAYASTPRVIASETPQSRILNERDFEIHPNYISLPNPGAGLGEIILVYRPLLVMNTPNEVREIKNRRDLNRFFPAHRTQIRNFLRGENISFDVREDLIKLAGFLNSLD